MCPSPVASLYRPPRPPPDLQSYAWTKDTPAVVEGGDQAYLMKDGLMGTEFTFALFQDGGEATTKTLRRMLIDPFGGITLPAGSVASSVRRPHHAP